MIVVIDYGMGNLRSVTNAFEAIGENVQVTSTPSDVADAERVVLPGVGAFGEAIARLRDMGMADALERSVIHAKRPMLGICLGMQLLAERSFEHGEHSGLGWIPGTVTRLDPSGNLRVPHVGWNDVKSTGESTLFHNIIDPTFYFVHSFSFHVAEPTCKVGTTDYGGMFVASVERDHIFGTQFHPEKSHKSGLALLRNFASYGR